MEAQRGYVTCPRSHSQHQEKSACGSMCVYVHKLSMPLPTHCTLTCHPWIPSISLFQGKPKGVFTQERLLLHLRSQDLSISFLQEERGIFEIAHVLVFSQRHFSLPPKELLGAQSAHEDSTLRPAPKSQERQVTSTTLSRLGENRHVYLSSPESEGVFICFNGSYQVSLGKAFRKMYNCCRYSSSVRLICSQAL